MKRYLFIVLAGCCLAAGCRKIELVNPTEYEVLPFGEDPDADPIGMYLLNEGNMGSNKADIDYLDYRTAVYARGIYAEKNPNVVKELGDVGNDIQVYDGRLFAVINCSHKVEVMDAYTRGASRRSTFQTAATSGSRANMPTLARMSGPWRWIPTPKRARSSRWISTPIRSSAR